MRSPPERRSRSPYCGSTGHRFFSFRMASSRGRGWRNGFKWESVLVRCLILMSWMSSCTVGIPRSLWIISLVTYRGGSTVALNKFRVNKSVHHRTIQINHQPEATIISVSYPDVYLQLNMFRAFSRLSSGAR
jgi:hypothetical protein